MTSGIIAVWCIIYRAYTRGDRVYGRSDRRPVYTCVNRGDNHHAVGSSIKQVFVAVTVHTRDDCRDDRRDSRLVYTLQVIVTATIAPTVAATIAPCIRPVSHTVSYRADETSHRNQLPLSLIHI